MNESAIDKGRIDPNSPPREDSVWATAASSGLSWQAVKHMIMDLATNRNRTGDFLGARADFIQDRVRALGLVFAAIVPLWIVLDFFIIPDRVVFVRLAVLRILCASLYLALAFMGTRPHNLQRAVFKLTTLMLLPCIFYIASRFALNGDAPTSALMVYSFFPFVIVAQLAVFPLTLIEAIVLAVPAFATLISVEFQFGYLLSMAFVGDLLLLFLLTGLSMWASMSELHMLLRLYRQATRDPLSGLFNRRALMERIEEEVVRAKRHKRTLSILFLDLDRFKRINDKFGHLTGDEVLKAFARLMEEQLRKTDVVGRYGGEEFLVVLPETDMVSAEEVAERIRTACATRPVSDPENAVVHFTTSVGVAQLREGETTDALLTRADDSLYRAKESGRDCVVLAA